jgi:hypothetical protein
VEQKPDAADTRTIGVLPKVTGLDHVIWLHRRRPNRAPYVEATPDAHYDRNTSLRFCLEPVVIGPTMRDDTDVIGELAAFFGDNLPSIMDYWEGAANAQQVIAAFRKPKYYR